MGEHIDVMYAPWRQAFVRGEDRAALPCPSGCIFCDYPQPYQSGLQGEERFTWDRERLLVTNRERAFVMFNRYPYGAGHVMVVPRIHISDLDALDTEDYIALNDLLKETVSAIKQVYKPHAMNIGLNMGAAAGAGIASHLHWHILPRWQGDINFMPAVANVRVVSEALDDAFMRLAQVLRLPAEGMPPHFPRP